MSKIISIVNQKGGVGKTTTSLNFAYELAKKDNKVLLVDFDSQGNLTEAAGIRQADNLEETIADAIECVIEGKEYNLNIHESDILSNLYIAPCNIRMAHTKLNMQFALAREHLLNKVLDKMKDDYDYIIIDTAPSLDIDMINALVASNEIIITSNPDTFSLSGVLGLFKTITTIKNNLNNKLKIAGILVTCVDQRTNFANDMTSIIKTSYEGKINVFKTVIPVSIKVKESQAMRLPISRYDKRNKVSKAYIEFTEEYIKSEEM